MVSARNVAFKSDELIDALFQDQSVAQTRPAAVNRRLTTLTSKARNAELYIFNQDDSWS